MSATLRVGADPFPPYQYINEDGVLRGHDYELVRDAFASAGYEIEVALDDWPKIEAAVRNGELDAAFQVQRTPEREALYAFSDLLRLAATEVITSNPYLRNLTSFDEIATRHLIIGVMDNYAYGQEIDELGASCKRTYANQSDLLWAISRGEVDVGIFDQGVKIYLMQREGIDNLLTVGELTFERPLYVVFTDPALRYAFNNGLRILRGGQVS